MQVVCANLLGCQEWMLELEIHCGTGQFVTGLLQFAFAAAQYSHLPNLSLNHIVQGDAFSPG